MISILVFLGCLALVMNGHLLMDNIEKKRYAIIPINVLGMLCSFATIVLGVGGSI